MKKILLLIVVSFFVGKNCEAQNTCPFLGLELSNYEVGDSLEYHFTSTNFNIVVNDYDFGIVIISKDSISPDSMSYQIKGFGISDTTQLGISNDSIYGNNNNFLFVELTKFDTSMWPGLGDSAFISFDTLSGNKRLKKHIIGGFIDDEYLAIQNLGIVYHYFATENPSDWDYTYDLLFAHLNHYGTYGTYVEIPSLIEILSIPTINFSLYPNPATEQLTIDNGRLIINEIEISDALGRVQSCEFIRQDGQRPSTQIDIHSLPSGLYFIKVYFVDGSFVVRKFVKE